MVDTLLFRAVTELQQLQKCGDGSETTFTGEYWRILEFSASLGVLTKECIGIGRLRRSRRSLAAASARQ